MAHTVVTDEQHASFVTTRAENALNFIFAYAPCLVLFLACGHIMHTVAVQISKIAKRWPMEKIFTGIIQGGPKRMETFVFCAIEILPNGFA